jgi:hypothetical protein
MPSYLVESYLPAQPKLLAEARSRARRAAELAPGVRYLRTTFLPEEETCFHLFEAPSATALGEAARRAQLGHTRIVEALETPA